MRGADSRWLVIDSGNIDTSNSGIVQDRQPINVRAGPGMQDDNPPEPLLVQVSGPRLAQLRDLHGIMIKEADHYHGRIAVHITPLYFAPDVVAGIQREKPTRPGARFGHVNRV